MTKFHIALLLFIFSVTGPAQATEEGFYLIHADSVQIGYTARMVSRGFHVGTTVAFKELPEVLASTPLPDLFRILVGYEARSRAQIERDFTSAKHSITRAGASGESPGTAENVALSQPDLDMLKNCAAETLLNLKALLRLQGAEAEMERTLVESAVDDTRLSAGGQICGRALGQAAGTRASLKEEIKFLSAMEAQSGAQLKDLARIYVAAYHPDSPLFQGKTWVDLWKQSALNAVFGKPGAVLSKERYLALVAARQGRALTVEEQPAAERDYERGLTFARERLP